MARINGKDVFFTPIVMGGSGGDAITDVAPLPTENIKDKTFYRLRSGALIVNRIVDRSYTIKCVDTLPESGSPANNTLYYNTTDSKAYGYVDSSLSSKVSLSKGWYSAETVMGALGYQYGGVVTDAANDPRDNAYRILIGFLVMHYKEGKWATLPSTDWLDNNVPRLKASTNEYTCKSYNHSAHIPGYALPDYYGFATTEILQLDALRGCEIDVNCNGYSDGGMATLTLAGGTVTNLDGGYAITVSTSGFYSCPDARVIVVTDTSRFNKMCNCDLESTGTYLSIVQRDSADYYTETTKVTALRLTTLKINNADLDLENNLYLTEKFGSIETVLDSIIAAQNSYIGG